jgi:hypothetical protein
MTLRLDNACGVDHMPTAAADENPIIGSWFGIDPALQMVPGKVRQNASLPRARSTRNGGRDQIGILGDLKSECLGEIIGIRTHLALDKDACAPIAHREEGRAHSLLPNPRRIAPRICSDLIFDRHSPLSVTVCRRWRLERQ